MRKIPIVTFSALWCVAAVGQNPLECVDPDVLEGLIFRSPAESVPAISTAMPEELSGITVPGQFSWIGSSQRNLGNISGQPLTVVTGAFKTRLTSDAALTLAAEALAGQGWKPGMDMSGGVFSSGIPPSKAACRDDQQVSVSANSLDNETYVLYNFQDNPDGMSCSQRPSAAFATSELQEQMPKLDLPPDPITGAPARAAGSGSGGGADERHGRVQFSHNDSLGNIERFLAQQLSEQGWSRDATWLGTSTAGSSWWRRTEQGATLQGTLQVTAIQDTFYTAMFRAVTLQ